MERITFDLRGDYVELNQLLKLVGVCDSGGQGKQLVAEGLVEVDGQVELRKTNKIRVGQVVSGDGFTIKVVAARLQSRVVERAMQIFCAMGLSPDTPLAALWTWGRAMHLMDGPDEVHLRTVARHELARARERLGASTAWFTTPEQMRAEPHLA